MQGIECSRLGTATESSSKRRFKPRGRLSRTKSQCQPCQRVIANEEPLPETLRIQGTIVNTSKKRTLRHLCAFQHEPVIDKYHVPLSSSSRRHFSHRNTSVQDNRSQSLYLPKVIGLRKRDHMSGVSYSPHKKTGINATTMCRATTSQPVII